MGVAAIPAANASATVGIGPGGRLGNLGSGEIQDIGGQTRGAGDSGGVNRRGTLETPVGGGAPNVNGSGGVPSRPLRIFAGLPGAIHPDSGAGDRGRWAATDPESFLRENLSLTDLVSLAYMFNFTAEAGVLSLGERKASVQVSDELVRIWEK